jgi:hypothetical protein
VIALSVVFDLLSWIRRRQQFKLLKGSQSLFLTNLIHNLAILQCKDRGAREVYLHVSIGPVELAHCQIIECYTGVLSATYPAANDIIAFGDQRKLVGAE